MLIHIKIVLEPKVNLEYSVLVAVPNQRGAPILLRGRQIILRTCYS